MYQAKPLHFWLSIGTIGSHGLSVLLPGPAQLSAPQSNFAFKSCSGTCMGDLSTEVQEVTLLPSLGLSLSLGSIQLLVVGSPCCLVACRGRDQPAIRATSLTNDNYFQHLLKYGCTHLDQQPVASSETRKRQRQEETRDRGETRKSINKTRWLAVTVRTSVMQQIQQYNRYNHNFTTPQKQRQKLLLHFWGGKRCST